jgi:hypothetical protein
LHDRQHLVEVLRRFFLPARALRRHRDPGHDLATQVDRHLVERRRLAVIEHLVGIVDRRPGGGALLLRQAIREDGEAAADDGRDAVVAGGRLARFREGLARLLIQPLELGRLPRLVREHGTVQRHPALPRAQVALLTRTLLEQRDGVPLGAREAVHVLAR